MTRSSMRDRRGAYRALWLVSTICLTLALGAPGISGATALEDERPLVFDFDGSDSSVGRFSEVGAIAIDEADQTLYAINLAGSGHGPGPNDAERVVCKFDTGGVSLPFIAGSAAGKSCLDGSETAGGAFGVEGFFESGAFRADVAIDNSGGLGGPGEGEQGRIYVSEEKGPVHAFKPDGSFIRTIAGPNARTCGIAVDREGNLLVGNGEGSGTSREKVYRYDPEGNPLEPPIALTHANRRPCRLAIDQSGEGLYVAPPAEPPTGLDKYVNGSFDSALREGSVSFDVTLDQFSPEGHVFNATATAFEEHEPCALPGCPGTPVPGSPFGRDLIGSARGIAYNNEEDWVDVADHANDKIKVFGPETDGTAPDVSCEESSEVERHSLRANCTIDPLGLANAYRFEWKQGTGASWGAAESSAPQSIEPTDSSPHQVSLAIDEYKGQRLRANTTYQVRLVGINEETGMNRLAAYSAPESTMTPVPAVPDVICGPATAITTEAAGISCGVGTDEEQTDWQIRTAALAEATQGQCEALEEAKFQTAAEGTIPEGEAGTVEIEAGLEGLDPAQSYCVRAVAANAGGPGKDDISFKTLAIPPSQASVAFAAPRTSTTARINAWVNPNGETDFEYAFQWREQGASQWSDLPIRESSIHAREPIVVAEELSGLEPATTYEYRLAVLRNEAGDAASLGEEGSFATRSLPEIATASPPSCPNQQVRNAQHATYLGACRGIELVNSPEKGNQNAQALGPGITTYTSPITADGQKVLWFVLGGAPGSPNGTQGNFLAKRDGSGWSSEAVAPPAAEQFGGGALTYFLSAATPNFTSFVFSVRRSTAADSPPSPTIARIRSGVQDVLKSYEAAPPNPSYESSVDLSDGGEAVLFIDADSGQLEDIGNARVAIPDHGIAAASAETVSLTADGFPFECGLEPFNGQSFPGITGGSVAQPGDHWIASEDGSRVYFKAKPNGSCTGLYGLYVRNRETDSTELIDPGAEGRSPEFLRSSPDGRTGLFVTRSALDLADEDTTLDLYRWEESAGSSSCVTCVASGPASLAEAGAGIRSLLVSDDLSHTYFLSERQLVEGRGRDGALNLYLVDGGHIDFVATVGTDVLNHANSPSASVDGSLLAFKARMSPFLGTDQATEQCIQPNGKSGPCEEAFLYDERTESLECISCRRNGPTTHSIGSAAGATGGPSLVLSADGATMAFVTREALLPSDVNGDADIYEWRAGVLHLISNGISDFAGGASAPRVWGIDASGRNVLFGLAPPSGGLTGFERDGVVNLYDARTDGGFPLPSPRSTCTGDSCQGSLHPTPPSPAQASATYHGKGNLRLRKRRCRKGKVRRRGRCVKRRRAKKHRRHRKRAASRSGRHGGSHVNGRRGG